MAGHKMWEKCLIQLPYSLDEVPPKFSFSILFFSFSFLYKSSGNEPITHKKKKNLEAPQNERFYFEV